MSESTPYWLTGPLAKLMGEVTRTEIEDETIFSSSSEPPLHVICEIGTVPTPDDITFILNIMRRDSVYIANAVEFLSNEMRSSPAVFGVTPEDVENIITNSPVSEPAFIFRLNNAWEIHFAEGRFKIAEECGIIVRFDGDKPYEVEDISQADAWYDPDTKEWVDY